VAGGLTGMAVFAVLRIPEPKGILAVGVIVLTVLSAGAYQFHDKLWPPPDPPNIDALRLAQKTAAEQRFKDAAIDRVPQRWDRLKETQAQNECYFGGPSPIERQAISDQLQNELLAIRQSVRIIAMAQGRGLIIQTAPNTFRIVFPVVMRIVPRLEVHRTPEGTEAKVVETSRVGATVIYTPMTTPVSLADIHVGDPAFSAEF
jgi:hypothetical protein